MVGLKNILTVWKVKYTYEYIESYTFWGESYGQKPTEETKLKRGEEETYIVAPADSTIDDVRRLLRESLSERYVCVKPYTIERLGYTENHPDDF